MESDLDKMNKDRRKAEEAYLESQQIMLEIRRIQRDGITNPEELILYVSDVIESVKHSEDLARQHDNHIVYSEAVGIRREMEKLLALILKDGSAAKSMEVVDGTEEAHRENNKGEEGYA